MSKAKARNRPDHEAGNLRAAEVIAADPERYAGIMLTWARRFLERMERDEVQQSIFREGEDTAHGQKNVG